MKRPCVPDILRDAQLRIWDRMVVGKHRENHRSISEDAQKELLESLTSHYFSDKNYYPDPPEIYLATRTGQEDCADHVFRRLATFRTLIVPWLASIFPLNQARILEIGCGTGASTISLAEQGAQVVGVDESQGALEVARARNDLYGLNAAFVQANAIEIGKTFGGMNFGAIVFFAVLEHMTWEERCGSLRAAWELLRSGQLLIVIETPNRLWHTDHHTSGQAFFNWLPDDVAFEYSRFTGRPIYNEIFRQATPEGLVRFARWGRGVSYHDFVLSLGVPPDKLPVASYMQAFLRKRMPGHWLRAFSAARRFEMTLQKLAPNVPRAFVCPDLYLALRKP